MMPQYVLLIIYLSILEHIYKCSHFFRVVGNRFHVYNRVGHRVRLVGTFGLPWVQFRRICHCIRVGNDTCIH